MEQIFQVLIEQTRVRLNVKRLKAIFGFQHRPHRNRKGKPPRLEVVIERPAYELTIFKLRFGKLTLKAYTKGERVLGFEAIVHNTGQLRCGRRLDRFPRIVVRLQQMVEAFLDNLYCMDACRVSEETLDQLPKPSRVGQTPVGGVDLNRPSSRAALRATLALACDQTSRIVPLSGAAAGASHNRCARHPAREGPRRDSGRRRQTEDGQKTEQLECHR